jgi:hypothetical protein
VLVQRRAMTSPPQGPGISVSLPLDAHAPRAARYHVSKLDRPSPDLRDAAVLLTSELITQAVERCRFPGAVVELRAWMPADLVRVEIRMPRTLLAATSDTASDLGLLFFGELADRWSLDADGELACLWFEIDRHPALAQSARAS